MTKWYLPALLLFALLAQNAYAQTFNDGPMQLQVRLKNVKVNYNETDASVLGAGFAPDEIVVHIWARDNADLDGAGWQGGACHTYGMSLPGTTPAINEMLLNYTYTGASVPQFTTCVLTTLKTMPVTPMTNSWACLARVVLTVLLTAPVAAGW